MMLFPLLWMDALGHLEMWWSIPFCWPAGETVLVSIVSSSFPCVWEGGISASGKVPLRYSSVRLCVRRARLDP